MIPRTDIVARYRLIENATGSAAVNRQKMQAAIDHAPPKVPWTLRGASADIRSFHIDKTLRVTGGGRLWDGNGKSIPTGYDDDFSTRFMLRADTFGQTITTNASGAVATLTNRTVDATDLHNSIEFDTGWFTITAVDAGANTWTLDRDCTNSGGNVHPTGFYVPEPLQLANIGHTIDGWNFFGSQIGDTHNARVGIHVLTGEQTSGTPTGKHRFSSCSLQNFDYPLLFGPGMEGFGSDDDWANSSDSYADNIYSSDMWIESAKDCYVTRCDQAVVHRLFGYRAESVNSSFLRVDAGGKHSVDGLEVSGPSGNQCLVKLGKRAAQGVDGTISVSNFSFDGGSSTHNPQLLVSDFPSGNSHRYIHVAFRDGIINRDPANVSAAYLVDVKSLVVATFDNIQYGNYGFGDDTVKMTAEDAQWKPDLHFSRCNFASTNLEDIIDLPNSTGGTASFSNCQSFGVRKPDGVYKVTAASTGHWAYQEAFV